MKPNWIFLKIKRWSLNEKGSALPSALLLILLLAAFLTSFSFSAKNQVVSHHFIQKGYQARTMLALTELAFKEQSNGTYEPLGVYTFNEGQVTVSRLSEDALQFKVDVLNTKKAFDFSITETRRIQSPIEEAEEIEEIEEVKVEETTESEDKE